MVGGFVQQQQIWFVDQRAGQGHALARAARQAGDLRVRGQAEFFQYGAHARRALPVFMFAFRVADHVEHGGVLVQLGFLLDGGHAQARAASDVAIVGQGPAIEQPEQRGLAGAVAADQADAFAGLDGEVGMVQQRVMAVGQLDVCQGNEGCEGHVGIVSAASMRESARIVAGSLGPCLTGTESRGVLEYAAQGGLDDRGGCESIEEGPTPQGRVAANGRPASS